MKKKYSTPNLIKVVSLSAVMATLLSSVSPVFAAGLSIRGATVQSSNLGDVPYPHGSHGSVVLAGDDDFCGVDNVIGRGGKQQASVTQRITAEQQYNRFITNQSFANRNPYGTSTEKEAWIGEGLTDGNGGSGGYMGIATDGIANALPEAYGIYSFATGCGSAATGNYSTVFGAGATAKAGGAQAFGVSALASGKAAVAMGVGTEASGESTVAIGGLATALGENSIAVGTKARAEKNFAIAIGTDAEAKASGSIAIGGRRSDRTEENDPNRKVTAEGENAIAIGSHTYAKTEDSVAIGANAQVLVNDGVAIGGGSVSDRNKGVKGYDPYLNGDTTETGMAWVSTTGAFSVGEVDGTGNGNLTRQITGVAAGSRDTDAVNVAQLRAMRDVISGGGGWKLSANDKDPTDVHTGNTVDFSVKSKSDEGKDNLTVAKNTTENKHQIEFILSDTLKLTSVTTGKSTMSDDGFVIKNGPSMSQSGIDAGKQIIMNVEDAEEDTDAVNYKQLKEIKTLAEKGWKLSVDGNNATDVGAGSTVDLVADASREGNKNIKIAKDNNRVTFSLNDNLTLTSVATGNSIMNGEGFKFVNGGPNITAKGIDAGNKQITGVEEGTKDTDAVNYKQLKAVQEATKTSWQLAVNGGNATAIGPNGTVNFQAAGDENRKNIKIEKDDDHNVTFDLADDIQVMTVTAGESIMSAVGFGFEGGDGPSITVKGIHAGDKTIKGVAAGEDDTDAVNYKQLKDFTAGIKMGWKLAVEDEEPTDIGAESTVKFVGVNAEDGNEESKNIKITKNGDNTVKFDLNDIVRVKRVIAGKANVSDDGFVITGGPNMTTGGIDAGNKKITGVLAGTDAEDAVNYKQLQEIKDQVAGGALVKWDESQKLITVGKEKGGTKIDIAGSDGDRTIAGVKAAEKDNEAVNKKQLDDTIVNINNNIKNVSDFAVLYDKNGDNSVNYNSVTLGGDKGKGPVALLNVKGGKISSDSTEAINGSQVNKISGDVAKFFGGGAAFQNGAFVGPRYNLSKVSEDGNVEQKTFENVGDALTGLDANVRNVNSRLTHVVNNFVEEFQGLSEDALLWDNGEGAFVALHEKDGVETDSKIKFLADGDISGDSTDAINGSQLYKMGDKIANYFGGDASYENGEWQAPTFKVSQRNANGTIVANKYNNVADAFDGVDDSITDIYNQIKNVTSDILVKQDGGENSPITIGKATGGAVINVANKSGEARTISGVKAAVEDNEAVNKKQLDESIGKINNNIENISASAVLYDKNDNNTVNYESVTLGGNKVNGQVALHNVKDGEISDQSHDAINGSQINKISGDVAQFFGGGTSFENGVFRGPRYNLTTIDENGQEKQTEHNDVGSALSGLNMNIRHVNQHLLYAINDIADYFGGGAGYDDAGNWNVPTFKVIQFKADGTSSKQPYSNVADAFEGVNNTFSAIHNQISNITENSLVQQEGENGLITVGAKTGGTKISIANKDDKERILSGVKEATLSIISTEAVNGSQLFTTNQNVNAVTGDLKKIAENTSKYFGGNTNVLSGIEPAFLIQGQTHHNVTDAFTGVNTSITNIDNKISDVVKNSLVKQDGVSAPITIGKDTAGTEVNIAGYAGVARSISGVKAAEKGDEAVNKDQLDKSIKDITKDIETASAAAVLYDKDEDGNVNYGSVTLGGNKSNGPVALHNVKDGSISENSNDAINGSQINKISADIAKFFGGGAKFINGAFEGLKYTLSAIVGGEVGKANFYDVGSALTGLDKNVQDVNQRLTNVSNEFNQKIEDFSKDALLWDDDEEAFVARHEKDGQKTKSKLKYLLDGEIAQGSTDAITGNQLYSMNNQLANYFGGGAKYENGEWTNPTFKIVQVNADGTTVEKEHHNVADAFGDINNGMSNINNRIDDVINKVDTDALKWNDKEKAYDANRDGKPNKIINVADGKIVKGSKDAVNGGQLWETNERVTGVEKDVKHLTNRVDNISTTVTDIGETVFNIENKVNDIAEDAVRYDRDANGKKTNKITLAGGDASEPVLIDNVADGKIEKGSKEAVNGGQLHDYTKEQMKIILDESKHYTDQRVNNIVIDAIDDAVDQSKQYTDMKFNVLNYSIESVKKEARQAAAIGLAVSNLRYNDTPGKLSVGFGTGLWRSQSAFAFGAGYTSENGKYRSNISATTSGGHWGVGAGFNMTLN
ncbi:Vomp family autotransporter [Bartonella sp. CL100XZDX]|uniref:Vomp family autotransporter n=1 Tax=Bartonella sp. CL100XZDX TaxID=3243515 RepID=UPI0035D0FFBB